MTLLLKLKMMALIRNKWFIPNGIAKQIFGIQNPMQLFIVFQFVLLPLLLYFIYGNNRGKNKVARNDKQVPTMNAFVFQIYGKF